MNKSYFRLGSLFSDWRTRLAFLLLFLIFVPCECRQLTGLERLFDKIFVQNSYNVLVRPVDTITGLTHVNTEIKLLQINLNEK